MVMVYLTCLHYCKRDSDLDKIKWDILTVTPGDYTMQMEITEQMYNHFMEEIYKRSHYQNSEPIAMVFKQYIKRELERILNAKLDEIKKKPKLLEEEGDDKGINITDVKIADIVFAFNNDKLIKLLKVRGQHIMFQRYDKAALVEAEIMEYKNNNIHDLIRPVDAFITFEEEDGKIIAEEFEPEYNFWGTKIPSQKKFLTDELCLVEATEPTNIIWENRHFTGLETFRRSLRALAAIIGLLIASFLTIYYFKSKGITTSRMYPSIQQSEILGLYQTPQDNTTDNSKMQLFYEHAVQEFEYFN